MWKNCPDCGVPIGSLHEIGCDVERCPDCGYQFISCFCGEDDFKNWSDREHPRLPWTGEWPGDSDARALGLYCYWDDEKKWVKCDSKHPKAEPDLNRLLQVGRWDAEQARRVAR